MKEALQMIGAGAIAIIVLALLAFGLQALDIVQLNVLGVRHENAKTQVFERSQAYVQGERRILRQMMGAVQSAKTDDEREAAMAQLRHEAEAATDDAIPDDVRSFLAAH